MKTDKGLHPFILGLTIFVGGLAIVSVIIGYETKPIYKITKDGIGYEELIIEGDGQWYAIGYACSSCPYGEYDVSTGDLNIKENCRWCEYELEVTPNQFQTLSNKKCANYILKGKTEEEVLGKIKEFIEVYPCNFENILMEKDAGKTIPKRHLSKRLLNEECNYNSNNCWTCGDYIVTEVK